MNSQLSALNSQLISLRASDASPETIALLAAAHPLSIALTAGDPLPTEIVWMPAGEHDISAFAADGSAWKGKVICDQQGCQAVQATLARILAAGQRVPLDKDHKDEEATAWVLGFSWNPARGILARVEWTSLGEQLLRGKVYHSFSPAFLLNRKTGRVSGFPAGGHAAGGLVNAPAFGSAMPSLIAARLAGFESTQQPASGGTPDNQNKAMNPLLIKILAALKVEVPANATDEQLVALAAKHIDRLPEAGNEGQALKAQLSELTVLQAKSAELDALKAKDATRRKADAQAAVDTAVARGAIPAKDEAIQAKWRGMIESNPDHAELLAALPDNPALTLVTQPGEGAIQARDGLSLCLKAYDKAKSADARAAIYARDIAPAFKSGFNLGPILAANSLGSLAGDLITQRSLGLLKFSFPVLNKITTDFSDQAANLSQNIKTRTRGIPTATDYVAGTGYTSSDSTDTDVTISMSSHKAVQLRFNTNELASTNRDLFGEQVEAAHYALGKAFCDALYALITGANFTNKTTKAMATFARGDVIAAASALAQRGVQSPELSLLLNPGYFAQLMGDSTIVNLAVYQQSDLVTGFKLPALAGFQPLQALNLAAPVVGNGYAVGLGFAPDALAMATRVPAGYVNALPGASNGVQSVVTNPDTRISVQLTQFVDHKLAEAYWRIAVIFGAAVGQASSGQLITSQ